jgi:type IV secretory pathway VirD2 relaxase
VSPEDADALDLTGYVRTLMGRVERDLGRKLEWGAVNHYDTAASQP